MSSRYTCPDCAGAIEKVVDGDLVQYRCRVGHLYSPLSALNTHHEREENTLWSAVVVLEEGADLAEELAKLENGELGEQLSKVCEAKRSLARRVRDVAREFADTIPIRK